MELNIKAIAFKGAAAIMLMAGVIFLLRSAFVSEVVTPCSERYTELTEFNLDSGNGILSPAQLVAMIGPSQRDIYNNAKVVRVRGVPGQRALKVAVENKGMETGEPGETNGIGFLWSPQTLTGAKSACLTYSVYLPKDFDFGGGGVLPGLYAGKPLKLSAAADPEAAIAQRIVWRNNNRGNLYAQLPGDETNGGAFLSQKGFELPTGRWVQVEQELELNTPGVADGSTRVWVDGDMVVEKKWLNWRKSENLQLAGVMADVGYGVPRRVVSPPKDTKLYLSPMQLRWQ